MRWADNVVEESTTTTTGAYQLGGVPASGEAPGTQTFVAGIGTGQTCYYYAKEVSGAAWERGIGTVTDATPDTLTRTTIHGSSNSPCYCVVGGYQCAGVYPCWEHGRAGGCDTNYQRAGKGSGCYRKC